MARDIELPFLLRDGQLLPGLLALWEEACCRGTDKPLRIDEKPVERGTAAGGDDGNGAGRNTLDSRVADRHRSGGEPRRLAQKGAFACVRFDQFDPPDTHDREHQSGKPGAAAEIDQAVRRRRDQRMELRRIEKVAAPRIGQRARRDQVDARRPGRQQPGIGLEPGQRFIRNAGQRGAFIRGQEALPEKWVSWRGRTAGGTSTTHGWPVRHVGQFGAKGAANLQPATH